MVILPMGVAFWRVLARELVVGYLESDIEIGVRRQTTKLRALRCTRFLRNSAAKVFEMNGQKDPKSGE